MRRELERQITLISSSETCIQKVIIKRPSRTPVIITRALHNTETYRTASLSLFLSLSLSAFALFPFSRSPSPGWLRSFSHSLPSLSRSISSRSHVLYLHAFRADSLRTRPSSLRLSSFRFLPERVPRDIPRSNKTRDGLPLLMKTMFRP